MISDTKSPSVNSNSNNGYGATLLNKEKVQQTRPSMPSMLWIHGGLALAYAFWGGGAFVSKFGIHESSPIVFEMIRETLSAPVMFIFAALMGARLYPDRQDIPAILISAFFFGAGQCSFFIGLKHLDSSIAATYQTLFPVLATAMAVIAGQEQSSLIKWLAIVLAAGGAFVMALGSILHAQVSSQPLGETLGGHFLFLGQIVCVSAFVVVSKNLSKKYSGAALTAWIMVLGAIMLLLLHEAFSMNDNLHRFLCVDKDSDVMQACLTAKIGIQVSMIFPLCYEVICCTLGGWCIINWANKYADASVVTIYCVVQPTSAMFIAIFFIWACGQPFADKYGIEMPGVYNWVGLALIVIGLGAQFLQKQEQAEEKSEEDTLVPETSKLA